MRRAEEKWRGLYVGTWVYEDALWRKTYLGEDDDFTSDVFEGLSCVHSALLVNKIQGR